jgi:hypothetical protein
MVRDVVDYYNGLNLAVRMYISTGAPSTCDIYVTACYKCGSAAYNVAIGRLLSGGQTVEAYPYSGDYICGGSSGSYSYPYQKPAYIALCRDCSIGTLKHEFFHILGFGHEDERPDRNAFFSPETPRWR